MPRNTSNAPLDRVREIIAEDRARYRYPLFIVGAGVSASCLPLMGEIFDYFLKYFDKHQAPAPLQRLARRLARSQHYQSRAVASHFFGILQDSLESEIRDAWRAFTRALVLGELKQRPGTNRVPIWHLGPTDFHRFIAKELLAHSLPAVCVSLNYDGLTAKAVHQEATKRDVSSPSHSLRILNDPDQVLRYYSRTISAPCLHPVIKLRGDILTAVCSTSGCPHRARPTPIYDLLPLDPAPGHSEPLAAPVSTQPLEFEPTPPAIMACPVCGKARNLEITFPGVRTKEALTVGMLEMLLRLVIPSTGSIIVCGVSGHWDAELIAFLQHCISHYGINIYCLDKFLPPPLQAHIVWAVNENIPGAPNVHPLKIDFDDVKL